MTGQGVFEAYAGRKAPDWHAADLAKTFHVDGVVAPRPLQVEVLERLAYKTPLAGPPGADTVHEEPPRRVIPSRATYAREAETGQ